MRDPSLRPKCFLRTLVLWSLIAATAWAAAPSTPQVHGTLTRVDGVRVLRVWGTPAERGYAQGYLLASDIVTLLDEYLDGNVLAYRTVTLPMTRLMRISPEYEAELRGMLTGIESRSGGPANVPSLDRALAYDDLVAINCIPDLALFGCSSFAAWGSMTADGGTLAGRNLDWRRLDALDGSQIVVAYAPWAEQKRLGWVSVTWPGYIGCLTGMNAEGVTVSMHDVRAGPPTTVGFTPRGLTLRDAIESARAASAVEDVGRVLRGRTSAVGNNVPVAVPHTGKAAASVVFEYDGVLSLSGGVTVRTPDERSYQVCTNHYVKRAQRRDCQRFAAIQARLTDLATRDERLDLDGAWEILRTVERPGNGVSLPLLTYQSVVFEPNRRRLHVALSREGRPAPRFKPVTFTVGELLNKARAPAQADKIEAPSP